MSGINKAGEEITTSTAYRDWLGARHHRSVAMNPGLLRVQDQISGFQKKAILRWRLMPGNWFLVGDSITNGRIRATVTGNMKIRRMELTEGRESRYYLQQTALPVLEVEVDAPGTLITTIEWE